MGAGASLRCAELRSGVGPWCGERRRRRMPAAGLTSLISPCSDFDGCGAVAALRMVRYPGGPRPQWTWHRLPYPRSRDVGWCDRFCGDASRERGRRRAPSRHRGRGGPLAHIAELRRTRLRAIDGMKANVRVCWAVVGEVRCADARRSGAEIPDNRDKGNQQAS